MTDGESEDSIFTENFQIDNVPGPSIGFFLPENNYRNRGRKIKRGICVKPNNLNLFRLFQKQSEFFQIVSKTI